MEEEDTWDQEDESPLKQSEQEENLGGVQGREERASKGELETERNGEKTRF